MTAVVVFMTVVIEVFIMTVVVKVINMTVVVIVTTWNFGHRHSCRLRFLLFSCLTFFAQILSGSSGWFHFIVGIQRENLSGFSRR